MGYGKYYCDYCDKEFQDNPVSRRRHVQGSQHLKAKALWYNSFNIPSSIQVPLMGGRSSLTGGNDNSIGMSWGNLPPSLIPPTDGCYPPLPFLDWG